MSARERVVLRVSEGEEKVVIRLRAVVGVMGRMMVLLVMFRHEQAHLSPHLASPN